MDNEAARRRKPEAHQSIRRGFSTTKITTFAAKRTSAFFSCQALKNTCRC